jgi:hypothetical protein
MPDFKGKIGTLPAYAWGGIAGVGALGYFYLQNRKAKNAVPLASTGVAPDSTGPTANYGTPTDALGNASVFGGAGGYQGSGGSTGNAVGFPILGAGNVTQSPAPVQGLGPDPTTLPADVAPTLAAPVPVVTVSPTNVGAAGGYRGPEGVPRYTQSQLNGMTDAQRNAVYSGSYTLLPDSYAPDPLTPTQAAPVRGGGNTNTTAAPAGGNYAEQYARLGQLYGHPVDAAYLKSQTGGHPIDAAYLNGLISSHPATIGGLHRVGA